MKKLSKQQKNILKHYVGKQDKREAVNAADVELGRVAGNELHAVLGYVDCVACEGTGGTLWDAWGEGRVEYCRCCDGYGFVSRERAERMRIAKAG